MKFPSKALYALLFSSLATVLVGCKPTIDFKADFTDVAPGDEVELEWEVELAKGTNSSRVTVSDLGEVELEGSGRVVVDDTRDLTIRVSAFVLGLPVTTKEKLTINVIDENFNGWDFDEGANGWSQHSAFYHIDDERSVLCDDDASVTSPILESPPGETAGGIRMCFDNDEDDDSSAVYRYVQRKVSSSDDYELDKDKTYEVGYTMKWAIHFDDWDNDDCENLALSSNDDNSDSVSLSDLSILVGAANETIEQYTDDDNTNDIVELRVEPFVPEDAKQYVDNTDDIEYSVNATDIESSKNDPDLSAFISAIGEINPWSGVSSDEINDLIDNCKDNKISSFNVNTIGSDTDKITQVPSSDEEMWLMLGFNNRIEKEGINIYIREIRAVIQEKE